MNTTVARIATAPHSPEWPARVSDRELRRVLQELLKTYAPNVGEQEVRRQFQRCQCDLDGLPLADLPELLYRLAQQRLKDLRRLAQHRVTGPTVDRAAAPTV